MNRHYWSLLLAERGVFLLGLTLSIVTAFAGIALLAVSGWFISAAALAGVTAAAAHAFNFFTPGAIVRGLSIARTAGRYGERLANHEATFRLISTLRRDIFSRLANSQNISARMNRHDSASQMLQDIQNIEGIHLHSLVPAITALFSALGFILVTALFLPDLAIASLPLILLALAGIPWLYAKAVLEPESELHLSRNALWSRASGIFSSLRLLTLSQQLEHEGNRLRQQSRQSDLFELQALKRQQLINLLSQLINLSLVGLTLLMALQAYLTGELAGALIFMLLLLSLGTIEVFAAANGAISHLLLGQRALSRLGKSSKNQQNFEEKRTICIEKPYFGISIKELSYAYEGSAQSVFEARSVEFNQLGLNWIAGQSGRGKTTLLRLIAGELELQQGSLIVEGTALSQIAYLPQRVQIVRSTLRHNLDFTGQRSDEEIISALQTVELGEWVESLPKQLDTWIGPGEWEPSGGELKRIGLARLLLKQADILLLDEPFAGMDAELQSTIVNSLRDLWQHKLVILVSHDLEQRASQDALHQL